MPDRRYRMNESKAKRRRPSTWPLYAGVLLALAFIVLLRFEGC